MNLVSSFESEFSDPKEFKTMFDFMNDFYNILEDILSSIKIVAAARTNNFSFFLKVLDSFFQKLLYFHNTSK